MLVILLASLLAAQAARTPAPLERLQANIERITRSVNADWGVYVKCIETGEQIASMRTDRWTRCL